MSQNECHFIGNLTRDPDLRFTSTGVPVANLGVAVNRRYTTSGGAEVDEVMFIDAVVWRDPATNVAASLSKGDRVIVSGRLELHEFETTTDGVTTTNRRHRIICEDVAPSLRFAQADVKKIERTAAPDTATVPAPSLDDATITDEMADADALPV